MSDKLSALRQQVSVRTAIAVRYARNYRIFLVLSSIIVFSGRSIIIDTLPRRTCYNYV